jgi:hypothetical protein
MRRWLLCGACAALVACGPSERERERPPPETRPAGTSGSEREGRTLGDYLEALRARLPSCRDADVESIAEGRIDPACVQAAQALVADCG